MTCNVTGTAISPNGQIKPGAKITFRRAQLDVVSQEGSFVIPDDYIIQTALDGTVDFDILPGVYDATTVAVGGRTVAFRVSVPDEPAADFADLLNASYVEIPPASVTQAQQARDAAIDARDVAVAARDEALLYDGPKVDTFAELASVTPTQLAVGEYIRVIATGAVYQRVSTGGDLDYTGSGGVRLAIVPAPDVHVRAAGVVANGTTNDAAALASAVLSAQSRNAPLDVSRGPYLVNQTINIPASVYVAGQFGSRYANPSSTAGGAILCGKSTSGALIYRQGTILRSMGGGVDGMAISGADSLASTNLSGVNLYAIEFNNVFNEIIRGLTIEHFNGATAVHTSGQCNKLLFLYPRVTLVGTGLDSLSGLGVEYGAGFSLGASPDSELVGAYIEGLGGIAVILGDNCKVSGGFIDLCRRAVFMTGERPKISELSAKFHKRTVISAANTLNARVSGGAYTSSNTARLASTEGDAAIISLQGNNRGFSVRGADFQHIQQWRGPACPPVIHLGPNDGSSATMSGVTMGDVVAGGTHVVDPNGLWAAGQFSLANFALHQQTARRFLQTPVAYASGLTVNNDRFTVIYAGKTYVANGKGSTFPFTTGAWTSSQWVELDELDLRGLVIPSNVRCNIGNSEISGTSDTAAITAGINADVDGVVVSNGNGKFFRGGSGSVGPRFKSNAMPTAIVECTSTAGIASVRGWAFPRTITHTGSGAVENTPLAPLASRFQGRVSLVAGYSSSNNRLSVSANVAWNGTTLTVTDLVSVPGVAAAGITFSSSGGNLCLSWAVASAQSTVANIDFDGMWSDVTTS